MAIRLKDQALLLRDTTMAGLNSLLISTASPSKFRAIYLILKKWTDSYLHLASQAMADSLFAGIKATGNKLLHMAWDLHPLQGHRWRR